MATPADVTRLAELARLAVTELAPQRGGALWARQDARQGLLEPQLTAELLDPDRLLVVGTIDGCSLGYAAARVDVLPDGGRLAVLTDLYTEPGARGVGVGEAMMDLVLQWASEQGCFGIDSVALPGNRDTKNFFESYGLVARAIVVHRALDPERREPPVP